MAENHKNQKPLVKQTEIKTASQCTERVATRR